MAAATVDFRAEGETLRAFVTSFREKLHRFPELSGEEFHTCETIRQELCKIGAEVNEAFAAPNTVALLKGALPGPTIALRADIDALPIREARDVPYRSTVDGVMHACGHDAHTAMLLGAAMLLQPHLGEMRGSVKLIFQSSEEKSPGGAMTLVKAGVLENPHVDMIFAQHVQAHIPCGKTGVFAGSFMAACDDFVLHVHGKSCHAAHPQRGVDAIYASAQIVLALQGLISRFKMPVVPAVLSVCTIQGGEKSNIIAGEVTMSGTLRTLDEAVRKELKERMAKMARQTAEACGATCEVEFFAGYPCVCNDAGACARMRGAAEKILGTENVIVPQYPSTGSEDFAWYQQQCPGVIAHLGCGNEAQGITSSIHTPAFDIDPACLPLGAAILAQTAWDYLRV